LFRKECLQVKGEAAYRAGALADSERAFTALQESADTEADRLRAGDFLDRITWTRSRGQGPP
jgi:hypothetical protein